MPTYQGLPAVVTRGITEGYLPFMKVNAFCIYLAIEWCPHCLLISTLF
jgi:hypothetical protein